MATTSSFIPWRRRLDVVVRARKEYGAGGYVVKDSIALRYYQLGDEEHFVWSRLDGRQTVSGLCAAFAEAFLPRQLSPDELQRFVGKLIAQGLVIGDQARTAVQIDQRVQRQRLATNAFAMFQCARDPFPWSESRSVSHATSAVVCVVVFALVSVSR